MFRAAAKGLSFLWRHKKRALAVLLLALLFFALRFPWNEAAETIVRNAQKRAPGALSLDFESAGFTAFPPGLALQGASFAGGPFKEPLILESLSVSPDLGKWLALKMAWAVRGRRGDSSFALSFWRKAKKTEGAAPRDYLFAGGRSPLLRMEFFQPLWPKAKASGRISFRFQYEGEPKNIKTAKGMLELKGSQIKWEQARIETRMGDLELPPLSWSEGKALFRFKDGDLIIESLSLGASADDLHIQIRGNGEIKRSYKRFRLGSYDFQMQIDAAGDFPLSFLDLMLSGIKEEAEGRVKYRARITGRGSGPPDIEKLLKF